MDRPVSSSRSWQEEVKIRRGRTERSLRLTARPGSQLIIGFTSAKRRNELRPGEPGTTDGTRRKVCAQRRVGEDKESALRDIDGERPFPDERKVRSCGGEERDDPP